MGYLTEANIGGVDYKLAGALYGACATPAATAAKIVTCADFDSLETGVTIHVRFSEAQSAANPTLNVNGTGAKSITGGGSWSAGMVASFTYDGTNWIRNDGYFTDTKNTAGSTNSASKLFLVGATSQAANPQTYSNSGVYATNGALVCGTINTGNGAYEVNAAAAKGVDTNIDAGSTSTNLPTSQAVAAYVASQAMGAAMFRGTLVQSHGSGVYSKYTEAELEASDYVCGWYWVCETAGTYAGNVMEVGDMLFCVSSKDESYSASDFTAIQNNIETLTTTEIDNLWAAA